MEVLDKKDFEIDRLNSFFEGFLKSYDIFGIMNRYNNVTKAGDLKTYSYKESFIKTGSSLKKYIDKERAK